MRRIVKSITLDKELVQKIEMLCATLNRSFSNYIESLLKQEIENLGDDEEENDINIKYILKTIPEIIDVIAQSPHQFYF